MLPAPIGRFLALDGLRGVAALLVLVFHLFWNSAGSEALRESLPSGVVVGTGLMRSGVAVFFVISGFVIAYTTRDLGTGDESARFIARRQIRLDPPYYAVIAFALIIEAGQALIPGLDHQSFTVGEVILNMVYLQDIAGVPAVLSVAWTLCLEVQFYLVVIIIAFASSRLTKSDITRRLTIVSTSLLLMALSLGLWLAGVSTGPWVLGAWWMFASGMVLAWYVTGWISARILALVLGALVGWVIALTAIGRADAWGGEWFAVATTLLVAGLLFGGLLGRSPGRTMLYFGRISYSLYLIHVPVIVLVTGPLLKVLPDSLSARLSGLLLAGAASIAAAHLLYALVEARSVRWSKRVRRSRDELAPRPNAAPGDG